MHIIYNIIYKINISNKEFSSLKNIKRVSWMGPFVSVAGAQDS